MSIVESHHFTGRVEALGRINEGIRTIPGATLVSERSTSEIRPVPMDHYIDQFGVERPDGTKALIDIHYLGNTGLKVIFPTIVRLNEDSIGSGHQTDIFSIDANGHVLAHTNMSGPTRVEVRDTSFERMLPYEQEVMQRMEMFPLEARLRITDAFYSCPGSQTYQDMRPRG